MCCNALNQRVAKKVNGTIVEKYLWANLTTLLAIYDKDDNLVQRFEYSDGRMPTSMTQNNTKYYLHYDQVGSLRAVSDISGNIIKEITYDTYGNILTDTNEAFKVPFGFAGGLYDSDTKLTRFGYRDYDSYTGKWTAKDPIDFNGGDTNLYGYVLGDPVSGFDPMGLMRFFFPRALPRFPGTGRPIPDCDLPHTQLGKNQGKNPYGQSREWSYDENGKLVPKNETDWTNHGNPKLHPNPHKHNLDPNTGKRTGGPEPLPVFDSVFNPGGMI